jgi:hypothetical protein
MKNKISEYLVIPQRLRNAVAAGFLLVLCGMLQGCATSTFNRAAYTDSHSQALINMELNKGAETQESPCIRLVSFRF